MRVEVYRSVDLLLGPFVLAADLIFLLRCEVVLDVESFADLLWRFSLDHVCYRLAANVKESFNIEIVGGLMVGSCQQARLAKRSEA